MTSEPAGTCQPAGDPPIYWSCTCADGYSVNPRTALCRKGSACVAAGGDQWPVRIVLDTSDCASRAVLPCSGATPDADVFPSLRSCLPTPSSADPYGTVRLELVNGCVSVFEMNGLGWNPTPLPSFEADRVPCDVQKLSSIRFACGHATDCVLVSNEPPGPM